MSFFQDAHGHRERELKQAEQKLANTKKAAEKAAEDAVIVSQEMEALKLEVKELQEGIKTQQQQVEAIVCVLVGS